LLKIGGKDCSSFALFMANFIGVFKASLCGLRRLRNVNDGWNGFIAGALAGTTLLIDSNRSRRVMIALYLSTRMLHYISRFIWRRYIESRFLSPVEPEPVRTLELPGRQLGKLRQDEPSSKISSSDVICSDPNLPARLKTIKYYLRQFLSTSAMMLSSSQILNAFICEPDTLPVIFFAWIIFFRKPIFPF
jgi:hypothetical protein